MNRLKAAQKFATNMVNKYDLIPPINPINIIKELGCKITEKEIPNGVEACAKLGDNPEIIISTNSAFKPRRMFTLAHELGHLCIPWHNGDIKCDTENPFYFNKDKRLLDIQELEANIFASELLMPSQWLKQIISENINKGLEYLLTHIQNAANTSIMACFYALENSLPSGHLIFVKWDSDDYWKRFASQRTYSTRLYYGDEEFNLLDKLSISKEKFRISQYEVKHYTLFQCDQKDVVKNVYKETGNLEKCLNHLSNGSIINILFCLDYILDSIEDLYMIYVSQNSNIIKRLTNGYDKNKKDSGELSSVVKLLDINNIDYSLLKLDLDFSLLMIKDYEYPFPKVPRLDPNVLLKTIVNELYDSPKEMRMSINGIVSSANSRNKNANSKDLYNILKYRFLTDSRFNTFIIHKDFDVYLANKVKDMIEKRILK